MSSISDLLIHRVDHIQYTVAADAEFGKVNDEVVIEAGIACRIQPRSSVKRKEFAQFTVETTHVVYFDDAFMIAEQEILAFRAVDSGAPQDRYFQVTGCRIPDEMGDYTIVGCTEFDAFATKS
jgi:hypothetical protein